MGYFAWDGDNLMIPASGFGMSDEIAMLNCSFDGVPVTQVDGAVLVPEWWARKEKPEFADVFDAMRRAAMKHRD